MGKRLGIGIAMFILALSIVLSLSFNRAGEKKVEKGKPKIILQIQQQDYDQISGQLEIAGIAKNTGDGPADNPTIMLTVTDKEGATIVVEKTTPEGYKERNMDPDEAGEFRFSISVPGKPNFIDGQLSVIGIPFETKWPYERLVPK